MKKTSNVKTKVLLLTAIFLILLLGIGAAALLTQESKTSATPIERTTRLAASNDKKTNLTYEDMEYLAECYENYIKENASANEEDINNYLRLEINRLCNDRTLNEVEYEVFGKTLTDAEFHLSVAHPIIAVDMFKCSNVAVGKVTEFFGYNGEDDNADAFRHSYWNALMTKRRGVDMAKQFADAHEDSPHSVGLAKEMDLANNETGRTYATTYSSLSESDLALRVLGGVISGEFKRIVNESLVKTNHENVKADYTFATTDLPGNSIRIDAANFEVIGNYNIPETLNGRDVTEIGADAFKNQVLATQFSTPSKVVSIGSFAFAYCTKMGIVTHKNYDILTYLGTGVYSGSGLTLYRIPNITNIAEYTFANCDSLIITDYGPSLTSIGAYAFYNTKLQFNTKFPSTVTSIGAYAFYNSEFSADFALSPNNQLTGIGAYAFANNAQLTNIVLSNSISSIGRAAFSGCDKLTVYAESYEKPYDWDDNWNISNRPVFWNCQLENKYMVKRIDKSNSSNLNAANGISNPNLKDYNFDGWYRYSDFTGTKYTDLSTAPDNWLYAKWTTPSCVAEGSFITLADGSQVAVENLVGNEQLLVWNLFTGTFDVAPVLFIDSDPVREYKVINLTFSDGTVVKVIDEHGFWDFDLNEYVFLRDDAAQYVGHWFLKQKLDESGNPMYQKVKLTNVTMQTETTSAWSPVSYGHLCYFVDGMLSMPGATTGLINIFDVDPVTMKIDETAFLADIGKYGLFTFEEFAETYPVTEEIFEAFGGQYLKVAMGKGLLTEDMLVKLIKRYSGYFNV